jgi:hypothetical protein
MLALKVSTILLSSATALVSSAGVAELRVGAMTDMTILCSEEWPAYHNNE